MREKGRRLESQKEEKIDIGFNKKNPNKGIESDIIEVLLVEDFEEFQ